MRCGSHSFLQHCLAVDKSQHCTSEADQQHNQKYHPNSKQATSCIFTQLLVHLSFRYAMLSVFIDLMNAMAIFML